ncbi:roadblock/LC7 domain-containing protein [Kitasatospora sp. NPDC048722]|uniref:roadblock/LC7 domain-containing protein n=1 Tax=Kitasatospora sp. NPDC048722 TaxID=3155639 RepID=UPI0033E09E78
MTTRDDQLVAEMQVLRDRVIGVTDIVVASADGLLITAETDGTESAEGLAALTAAALSIARRVGRVTSMGVLHHTVTQFTDGYLVAQAIGEMALIGILGDSGTDVKRLHIEAKVSAERIGTLLTTGSTADPGD